MARSPRSSTPFPSLPSRQAARLRARPRLLPASGRFRNPVRPGPEPSAAPGGAARARRPRFRQVAARACLVALVAQTAACGFGGGRRFFGGTPAVRQPMKVIVFYSGTGLTPSELALLAAHKSVIAAFTPLWYHVNNDGSVTSNPQPAMAAWARKEGIPLVPLVNNAHGAIGFLTNSTARQAAVKNLTQIVDRNNYAGLHVDFELLKPSVKVGQDLFMKDLNATLHDLYGNLRPQHKKLLVDVIPEGKPNPAGAKYDYGTLARYSDAVVMMTYDEHDNGSNPGPIASLPWVRQRVNVGMQVGIPRNKLIVGIADYGYDWPVDSSGKAVSGANVPTVGMAQIEAKGIQPTRDKTGDPHYSYTKNGQQHVVWYEDQVSVVGKVQLARSDGAAGVALWEAGYENKAYWDALSKALGG